MRLLEIFLTLFALVALGWSAEAAAAKGHATARVTLADDGAHVTIRLDRAVSSFRFAQADVVRDGVFVIATPGLVLSGDEIGSADAFRSFTFIVPPQRQEYDAKYPAFYRLGEGAVLFAPAILGHGDDWITQVEFAGEELRERLPEENFEHGFVFLGPPQMVERDETASFVFDPGVPQWLRGVVRETASAALASYREQLGLSLRHVPLVLVKHDPNGTSQFIGDVTDNAVTALRFHGPAWSEPSPGGVGQIRKFVLHEAFHFWNGGLAAHAPGTPSWLHEGGAEYASLVTARRLGWVDDMQVADQLTEYLDRCRTDLRRRGEPALNQLDVFPASLRYSCGPILQWLVDLHQRQQGTSVMAAWKEILTRSVETGRPYGAADFAAAAQFEALTDLPAISLFLETEGRNRWRELPAQIERLGGKTFFGATAADRSAAVMVHLLRRNCTALTDGQSFGFHTVPGQFLLETPAGCGTLAGDPPIVAIEGEAVGQMSQAVLTSIAGKCERNDPVLLGTVDRQAIAAPCSGRLATLQRKLIVERWRPAGGTP